MRAILLAKATATTLVGLPAMSSASQGLAVPRRLAWRITAMDPATSSQRR